MRPFQTVVQVLLFTFLANSTLAAPAPTSKEPLEARAFKFGSWTAQDVRAFVKEAAVTGVLNGAYALILPALTPFIKGTSSSNSRYLRSPPPDFPSHPLSPRFHEPNHDKDLTYDRFHSRRAFDSESLHARTTSLLSTLSDEDIALLRALSRREIEGLD
jgi:hypothetical protein